MPVRLLLHTPIALFQATPLIRLSEVIWTSKQRIRVTGKQEAGIRVSILGYCCIIRNGASVLQTSNTRSVAQSAKLVPDAEDCMRICLVKAGVDVCGVLRMEI